MPCLPTCNPSPLVFLPPLLTIPTPTPFTPSSLLPPPQLMPPDHGVLTPGTSDQALQQLSYGSGGEDPRSAGSLPGEVAGESGMSAGMKELGLDQHPRAESAEGVGKRLRCQSTICSIICSRRRRKACSRPSEAEAHHCDIQFVSRQRGCRPSREAQKYFDDADSNFVGDLVDGNVCH
jgi:hypothetical protein